MASFPFLTFAAFDEGSPVGPTPDGLGVLPEEECTLLGAPAAFGLALVRGNIVVKQ